MRGSACPLGLGSSAVASRAQSEDQVVIRCASTYECGFKLVGRVALENIVHSEDSLLWFYVTSDGQRMLVNTVQ